MFNGRVRGATGPSDGACARARCHPSLETHTYPPHSYPGCLVDQLSERGRCAITVFPPVQAWLQAAINLAKLEGPWKVGYT